MTKEIKEGIEAFVYHHKLASRSRKREKAYLRIAFSAFLLERGYTLHEIARYLNRDHSSIVHYRKQYENAEEKNYEDILLLYQYVKKQLSFVQIIVDKKSIMPNFAHLHLSDTATDYEKLRSKVLGIVSMSGLMQLKKELMTEINDEEWKDL